MTAVDSVPAEILEKEDYNEFKSAMIANFEESKTELFEKLIRTLAMTGRPSSYLCELQQIASKVGAGEELVCHKFLQALPANIKTSFGITEDSYLRQR